MADTASFYYVQQISQDTELGIFHQERIKFIEDLAKKNNFLEFKIATTDISVSKSHMNNSFEVSTSFTIELKATSDAVTALFRDFDCYSLSINYDLN